jgi:hypothetical protein
MYSAIGQDAGQLVCRDVVISGTASSVQLGGELDRSTASCLEQPLDGSAVTVTVRSFWTCPGWSFSAQPD